MQKNNENQEFRNKDKKNIGQLIDFIRMKNGVYILSVNQCNTMIDDCKYKIA